MATYAIGDIQGCFDALQALLKAIQFDPSVDVLWSTGDLVNRGPDSLSVLRFFKSLPGDAHRAVLGNHDLHLIAVFYGVRELKPKDTLTDILQAPDAATLIEWLCNRPLLAFHPVLRYVMTHAGLAPSWTLTEASQLALEVEQALQGKDRLKTLTHLFGNTPNFWQPDLKEEARLRCAVNYFTRMRYCDADGRLDFSYKGKISDKPPTLVPWFQVSHRANANLMIIFGHWASLQGVIDQPNLFPLDTGCVWGGTLTAMRLEDGKRFAVAT